MQASHGATSVVQNEGDTKDAETLAVYGRVALDYGLYDIAEACNKALSSARNNTAKSKVRGDLLQARLQLLKVTPREIATAVREAEMAARTRRKSTLKTRSNAPTGQAPGVDDNDAMGVRLTEELVHATLASREVESGKILERAMLNARRIGDPSIVEEAAVTIWNVCLRLMSSQRRVAARLLALASSCLEEVSVDRDCFPLHFALPRP